VGLYINSMSVIPTFCFKVQKLPNYLLLKLHQTLAFWERIERRTRTARNSSHCRNFVYIEVEKRRTEIKEDRLGFQNYHPETIAGIAY